MTDDNDYDPDDGPEIDDTPSKAPAARAEPNTITIAQFKAVFPLLKVALWLNPTDVMVWANIYVGAIRGRATYLRIEWAPKGEPGDTQAVPSEYSSAIRTPTGGGHAPQLIRVNREGKPIEPRDLRATTSASRSKKLIDD